ncbi:hypothetical protein QEG73_01050 [Chitinophagaceae bacterium 26-R-25]|nr:hypothetical protein [Chitinophagaceae bacterium 26-R-25]
MAPLSPITLKFNFPVVCCSLFTLLFVSCAPAKNATNGIIQPTIQTQTISTKGYSSIVATCPSNQQLVGGGYSILVNAGVTGYEVTGNYPDSNAWHVDFIDFQNPEQSNEPVVIVTAYCYTGDKNLNMEIVKADETIQVPIAFGSQSYTYSSAVRKKQLSNVVTAGGFKLKITNYDDSTVSMMGSYPQTISVNGRDSIVGWLNTPMMIQGNAAWSQQITNYVLYSKGEVIDIGKPFLKPVLEQGALLTNHVTQTIPELCIPVSEITATTGYFTTGGGYQITRGGEEAIAFYPILMINENNALASGGLFFGWKFAGCGFVGFEPGNSCNIYGLQIRIK